MDTSLSPLERLSKLLPILAERIPTEDYALVWRNHDSLEGNGHSTRSKQQSEEDIRNLRRAVWDGEFYKETSSQKKGVLKRYIRFLPIRMN